MKIISTRKYDYMNWRISNLQHHLDLKQKVIDDFANSLPKDNCERCGMLTEHIPTYNVRFCSQCQYFIQTH